MKKIALYIATAVLFTACNNTSETKTETPATPETTVTEEATAPKGKIDPICEMEYDPAWTEYTIYKGDTVKFCSETCKAAFEGNPEKYAGKLK